MRASHYTSPPSPPGGPAPGTFLEDLFVRPKARGEGYGKLLSRELATEKKTIGGRRSEWNLLKWNELSLKFYGAMGAKRLDEWVGMRVEGEGLERLPGDWN